MPAAPPIMAPPAVCTGCRGWYVKEWAGSCAVGAMAFSVPSPAALFAAPPLLKKYGTYCVLANGHSCSARHSLLPITKSLIGALAVGGDVASPEFSSNHGRLTARLWRLKFSALVPSGNVTSLACVHGPIIKRPRRAPPRPPDSPVLLTSLHSPPTHPSH